MTALAERATALRADRGWGYKRIARHLGVTRDQVRGWLCHGTCPTCGGPTAAHRGKRRSKVCWDCRDLRAREKDALALALYEAGASMQEIAAELGMTPAGAGAWLSYMRRRELPVGYRYMRR